MRKPLKGKCGLAVKVSIFMQVQKRTLNKGFPWIVEYDPLINIVILGIASVQTYLEQVETSGYVDDILYRD